MSAKRAIIDRETARKLVGVEYTKDMYFNPFLDEDMNICISEQEINQITNADFLFLKELVAVDKSEILKDFKTEEEWLEHFKKQSEAETLRYATELEKKEIKPIKK